MIPPDWLMKALEDQHAARQVKHELLEEIQAERRKFEEQQVQANVGKSSSAAVDGWLEPRRTWLKELREKLRFPEPHLPNWISYKPLRDAYQWRNDGPYPDKPETARSDLSAACERALAFVSGLSLQDSPVAEQRAARDLCHALMAALRPSPHGAR